MQETRPLSKLIDVAPPRAARVLEEVRSERLAELDERIRLVEKQLEVNLVERQEAVPQTETVVEVPPAYLDGPHLLELPREYVFLGALFMLVTLLPLSIAIARRMWHRSTAPVAAVPVELVERMNRVEHIVEATALEMERIGEGQRFMTSLLNESMAASRNFTVPAQRVANPPYRSTQRDAHRDSQRDALQAGESPLPGMITPV